MGTSQSSNGAPPNQPIVPPWTPDLPQDSPSEKDPADENGLGADGTDKETSQPESPVAPSRRFDPARRSIGEWANSGKSAAMRKGLGQYIKKGYGGSSTATKRLAGTAQTAGGLFSALAPDSENPYRADGAALSSTALAGKSAHEIIDIIVEAVRPVDGTQDCEASRDSMKEALSDLLTVFQNADLQQLSNEERHFVIERFVAGDVFRRIDLDLGKNIRDRVPNTATALRRLKDIKDYVKETVSAAFKKLAKQGLVLTNQRVVQIVNSAIRETCEVFEGYAE